ncbi:MAG: DUF134 domain-containing protein [Tissierellia bacterium]|nr:DUF134 domain-containing protein [Tissierellia bacterium]
MARPVKLRKVCSLPEESKFGPLGSPREHKDFINMGIDEYEVIRLIDLEGFSQEECARQMDVSRPTVQRIYTEARKKLAESLVNGKVLIIEGGRYSLCDGLGNGNRCGRGCHKHRQRGQDRGQGRGNFKNIRRDD